MNAIAQTVTLSTALVASLGHQVSQVSWAPDLNGYVGVCTTCGQVLTVSRYGSQWVFDGLAATQPCQPRRRKPAFRKAQKATPAPTVEMVTAPPLERPRVPRRLCAEVSLYRLGSIARSLVFTTQTGR